MASPVKITVFRNDSIQSLVADAYHIALRLNRDVTFDLFGESITFSPQADLDEIIETLRRMERGLPQA